MGLVTCHFSLATVFMDNLTHTLVGAALAETGLKRATPLGTATLLLAANFPDIDILTAGFGPLAYLDHHRGVTHSLAGVPVLAMLLAAIMWSVSRLLGRLTGAGPRARFGPLLALSLLAMATHPLLDFTNPYGWRPFLPWSDRWYYGDIAFVADPWIWVTLGGALFITTTRSPQPAVRRILLFLWGALFAVTAGIVSTFESAGWGIKLGWFAVALLAVIVRWRLDCGERRASLLSLGILAALLAYFGALTLLHRAALAEAEAMVAGALAQLAGQSLEVSALPMPANPFWWRAVVSTDRAFHVIDLNLLRPAPDFTSATAYDREMGDKAAILAAQRATQAQVFLRFARFPVAAAQPVGEQTESAQGASTVVEIRDVRFFALTDSFRVSIRLDKNLHPIAER
jgi:inner membrane protein